MPQLLQTLVILPDMSGHRFSSMSFGADRINQLRDEHLLLRAVAAKACGLAADAVTFDELQAYLEGQSPLFRAASRVWVSALVTAENQAVMLVNKEALDELGAALANLA